MLFMAGFPLIFCLPLSGAFLLTYSRGLAAELSELGYVTRTEIIKLVVIHIFSYFSASVCVDTICDLF